MTLPSLGRNDMLRDVIESDLSIFFEHQRDPVANRMASFPARDWDAFVAHWHRNVLGEQSGCKRTIVIGDDVAGNILSWNQDGKRLVGYWLGRAFWGRGIATAALAEFLAHDTTRPLHAFVAALNVGSIRVLEKCGFRRVGEGHMGEDGVEEYLFRLDEALP